MFKRNKIIITLSISIILLSIAWFVLCRPWINEQEAKNIIQGQVEVSRMVQDNPDHILEIDAKLTCAPDCYLDPTCDPADVTRTFTCFPWQKDWAMYARVRNNSTQRVSEVQAYIIDQYSGNIVKKR